jgi:hypothetical protein
VSKKLGVIVPYRNRYNHLKQFLDYLPKYLSNNKYDYVIIVVNQDNGTAFNRGMLCNIGFEKAKKLNCDYVVFHDVDMLPIKVDYSYSEFPVHLATDNLPFESYFGGITLFSVEDFETINGFSNMYWGWGFEDDDLRYRCIQKNIYFKKAYYKPKFAQRSTQHFNGVNAYCNINNNIRFKRDFTINLSVSIDEMVLDVSNKFDKYTLFNIHGYDFDISYTSFKRFQVQFWDRQDNFYQIFSNIEPPRSAHLTVKHESSENKVSFYVDGKLVGEQKMSNSIRNYSTERDIFVGSDYMNLHYLRGSIEEIFAHQEALSDDNIKLLATNYQFSPTDSFLTYDSANTLIFFFNSKYTINYKFTDLSGKETLNFLVNTNRQLSKSSSSVSYIPRRRKSKIKYLEHDNNGFNKGSGAWNDDLTRWNQLRYINEVEKGSYEGVEDGLSNLTYTLHGEVVKGKYYHLNVGL